MLDQLPGFLFLGVVLGGIYALFAVGLALIYGVMEFINVGHGEFFTFGGYVTFAASLLILGSPSMWFGASVTASFLLGVAVFILLVSYLQPRLKSGEMGGVSLVLTLGLSTFLQNTMLATAGADFKTVPNFVTGEVVFMNVPMTYQRLLVLGLAMLMLLMLLVFLKKTRIGMAIRAVSQNTEAAQAVGINISRIYLITFGLGVALAGAAGSLISPIFKVYPTVGFSLTLKGFAIIILGGFGSMMGALIGSFIIGVAESLAVMVISSEMRDIVAFSVMLTILVLRPSGLFGKPAR